MAMKWQNFGLEGDTNVFPNLLLFSLLEGQHAPG